jgi:predicted nuclease with TOPRIM domain
MPTVFEIKRSYKEDQTRLINESFELGASAQHYESEMSPDLQRRLGPQESERARAAEAANWADEERNRLRTRYEELDIEMRAAIEVRVEEVESILSPKEADFRDFAAAATATPEVLISAMDMALTADDIDAALVAFAAARQRDQEEVVAHAIDTREDWADLYGELAEAANDPELDPGDRFEMFAQPAPTKENILGAPQTDRNVFGMMR